MVDFKLKSQVSNGLLPHLTTDYPIKEVDEESCVVIGTPKQEARNSEITLSSNERHSLNASMINN
jgi:hypothetical protein